MVRSVWSYPWTCLVLVWIGVLGVRVKVFVVSVCPLWAEVFLVGMLVLVVVVAPLRLKLLCAVCPCGFLCLCWFRRG